MKKDLAKYRLEDSKDKLDSAEILFSRGKYKDSVSRSYYAMFSAARSLLATKGLDSVKHSGIISLFNQHFVKTGIVGKEMGKLLSEARIVREKSDYGDLVVVSKEKAESQMQSAKDFIQEIERALNEILKNEPDKTSK
jgi:hypothetical protein